MKIQKKEKLQNYKTTKVDMYTNTLKKNEKKNQTIQQKFQSTRLQN